MSADPRIEDLVRMRRLYAARGPMDGRAGITPDGAVSPAIRWSLRSVIEDAVVALGLSPADHARWREGMGLNDPAPLAPEPVRRWSDKCPRRGAFLAHSRLAEDPPGVCAHCGQKIG